MGNNLLILANSSSTNGAFSSATPTRSGDLWPTSDFSKQYLRTDALGAVAPGYKADLALLRADSVFLRPLNHPLNALVYAETGADVETVLVDGRIVLEQSCA